MVDKELAKRVVDFLNEVHDLDDSVLSELMCHRVKCNQTLADHESVQVSENLTVGFLGMLNGLCGSDEDGYGAISLIIDIEEGTGKVLRAKLLDRFERMWERGRYHSE